MSAIVETGFADWYEWCLANWGTKWSSYDHEVGELGAGTFRFKFETAWSFPTPIFEALIERYPTLTFDCACFNEGWNFAGAGQFGASVETPFGLCEATDALYEVVYGTLPSHDEDV